jgi:stearoyl-CoA desaturase (delta-9 desaturase)
MGFVWGGLVRIFLLHQVTYGVNSFCHLWGQRSFRTRDDSRDNWLFGVLGFGDGWHNGHHAFPTSARHGLLTGQFDFSYALIRILDRMGLAWDIVIPTEADIHAKRHHQGP